ncbi:DNA-binding protein [Aestuariivirga litoralis]|uniref:DNA-binding protein n=1 Tax=Aestuariivirga litoralis TaxID=2650924 RepID=A0A2W2BR89_9HYPH|nr:DNA-binding protein [Aestuariivirga litoralis]
MIPAPNKHTERAVSRRLHRKPTANYLGVSLSWLDKSRLRGDGPPFLQIGGRVVYDTGDLDTYLASRRRQSTSEPR